MIDHSTIINKYMYVTILNCSGTPILQSSIFNYIPDLMINILCLSKVTVNCMGQNPDLTILYG